MWHPNEKETNLLRHAIEYHSAEAQIIKAAQVSWPDWLRRIF